MARLFRFLMLLALLVAPFRMIGAHEAMAAPAPQAGAHHMSVDRAVPCGSEGMPSNQRDGASIDCAIACSVVATMAAEADVRPVCTAIPSPAPLAIPLHGLHPESDPPPPRFA
jgi:hypothetical protein